MIGTADLYYIPNHQFANRQYFIGTKTSYKLTTITGVKYNGNTIQDIQVPYSTYLERVNLVGIGGLFYDVIAIDSATQNNKSSLMRLILNPVVSYLSPGLNVSGYWERTPTKTHSISSLQIGNDILSTSRSVYLPKFNSAYSYGDKPFYVEICAKYDIITADSSKICFYGMIVPGFDSLISSSSEGWYVAVTGSGQTAFPSMREIINNIDTLTGIPSDSIINVAISPRCPWKYEQRLNGTLYNLFVLKNISGGDITPLQYASGYRYNRIDGSACALSANYTTDLTLTLSDFERYCGKVILTDERGNDVAVIPPEYFNSSNQLTYRAYAQSDINGIYTIVKYADVVNTLQEGNLPWLGDAWKDYTIRNLNYDREELSRNISRIEEQRNIDMINAVGGGIMTAAVGSMTNPAGALLGVAQMGLGVATSEMSKNLNVKDLYAAQRNREGLIKNSPSSNYQMGYGLNYIMLSLMNGARFKIQTPTTLTPTDFDNYIAYSGWPCNKYATISLAAGYIKGNLYSVPTSGGNPVGDGTKIDLLRKEIANGVRLVTS